jgi:hypothetical protein
MECKDAASARLHVPGYHVILRGNHRKDLFAPSQIGVRSIKSANRRIPRSRSFDDQSDAVKLRATASNSNALMQCNACFARPAPGISRGTRNR